MVKSTSQLLGISKSSNRFIFTFSKEDDFITKFRDVLQKSGFKLDPEEFDSEYWNGEKEKVVDVKVKGVSDTLWHFSLEEQLNRGYDMYWFFGRKTVEVVILFKKPDLRYQFIRNRLWKNMMKLFKLPKVPKMKKRKNQ